MAAEEYGAVIPEAHREVPAAVEQVSRNREVMALLTKVLSVEPQTIQVQQIQWPPEVVEEHLAPAVAALFHRLSSVETVVQERAQQFLVPQLITPAAAAVEHLLVPEMVGALAEYQRPAELAAVVVQRLV